jgi:hypothetical protein
MKKSFENEEDVHRKTKVNKQVKTREKEGLLHDECEGTDEDKEKRKMEQNSKKAKFSLHEIIYFLYFPCKLSLSLLERMMIVNKLTRETFGRLE